MARIVVAALNPEAPDLVAAVSGTEAELVSMEELDPRLQQGGIAGVVVVSDGVDSDLAVLLAGILGEGSPPAIEVHSQRWDGFHHSILSPVCRGVISGFGSSGVVEAVRRLSRG